MTFLHPEFLYLMLPPMLVLFYFILTQASPTAGIFNPRIFAKLEVRQKRLSFRHRNMLFLAVFILLIIAMAEPVIIEAKVMVKAPERTLTVALDISASMRTTDIFPSRLAVAKAKLLELIDAARTERIGIMAFGKDVYAIAPPTGDKMVLRQMAAHFNPDAYAEKGTDIGTLVAAADGFMQKAPHRDLLILTDGGERRDFSQVAGFAREHHIRISVLGVGTGQGAPLVVSGQTVTHDGKPVVTRLNPALPALATATGGYYATATTGAKDIDALMAALRKDMPGGEDGVKEITRYGQLFILPLGLALLLLLIATSSLSPRERVPVPPVILLAVLCCTGSPQLHAAQFDYELLAQANTLYAAGKYRRAANAYYRYAKRKGNDMQALYDSAHAFYRAGEYETAAELWNSIRSKELQLQFRSYYNLGNAEAMLGTEEHLVKAITAYQKALDLENDVQTQENLAIVRGRLMRLMQKKMQYENAAPGADNTRPNAQGSGQEAQAQPKEKRASTQKQKGEQKPSEAAGKANTAQMSDYEAAMWMRSLGQHSPTRLYKITPGRAKGGRDVDPW
jgi:Ca-activated chloride channel homolog